jgi:hypothetical protein
LLCLVRSCAQVAATDRFAKVVDFLRKTINRDSVVRAAARATA